MPLRLLAPRPLGLPPADAAGGMQSCPVPSPAAARVDWANAHKTAFLRARLFCLAVPLLQAEVPLALMIMAAQMAVAVIS